MANEKGNETEKETEGSDNENENENENRKDMSLRRANTTQPNKKNNGNKKRKIDHGITVKQLQLLLRNQGISFKAKDNKEKLLEIARLNQINLPI
jgi:hypothetical protein